MTNEEFNTLFRERTKAHALRIFRLINEIPLNPATKIILHQLGKSGSSIGANFRAFCRGRSRAEKFSKICIVVEEADECEYWLELLQSLGYGTKTHIDDLIKENLEIIKITQKIKTALVP